MEFILSRRLKYRRVTFLLPLLREWYSLFFKLCVAVARPLAALPPRSKSSISIFLNPYGFMFLPNQAAILAACCFFRNFTVTVSLLNLITACPLTNVVSNTLSIFFRSLTCPEYSRTSVPLAADFFLNVTVSIWTRFEIGRRSFWQFR